MHIECEKQFSQSDGSQEIYLMKSADAIKIGVSKHPEVRRDELQQGNQDTVELVKSWESEDAFVVEKKIHRRLFDKSLTGEWFEYDTTDLNGLTNAIGLFIDGQEA